MSVLNEEKILFNVLPLKDLVFFPHMVVPLIIGRKQSVEALENVLTDELPLFIVTQKNALIDNQHKAIFNLLNSLYDFLSCWLVWPKRRILFE